MLGPRCSWFAMPVDSNKAVLVGTDGMITMRPPATYCRLLDKTDFPAPVSPDAFSLVRIPANTDFRVGDPVTFTEQGTANLDGELQSGDTVYIHSRPSRTTVTISLTPGGSPIALDGNGGTGGLDTPGAENYIEMGYALSEAMCNVPSVELNITRGEIDTTALPCRPRAANGPGLAEFRNYQAGYADGSGTLTMRLTPDRSAFNNRIVQGSLFKQQGGALLSAYFSAIATSGGVLSNADSLYCEFPVTLLGFDTSITQEESPTELRINYRVAGNPQHLLGLDFI